jgi:hypothetical protein
MICEVSKETVLRLYHFFLYVAGCAKEVEQVVFENV